MKRFTETLKWAKPWFRQLSPTHKLLWQWMCDSCDNAGVLDADWGLASFQIGCQVSAADAAAFDGRVVILPSGKVWIPSFIEFQVTTLSRDCKAHGPIFTSLEKHGIDPDSLSVIGYPIGYNDNPNRVLNTLKEKEKEKETAKEKEHGKDNTQPPRGNEFTAVEIAVSAIHSSRTPKPFTPAERNSLNELRTRITDEELIADAEAIKNAKDKGWEFFARTRPAMLGKWESQADLARNYNPNRAKPPVKRDLSMFAF